MVLFREINLVAHMTRATTADTTLAYRSGYVPGSQDETRPGNGRGAGFSFEAS